MYELTRSNRLATIFVNVSY